MLRKNKLEFIISVIGGTQSGKSRLIWNFIHAEYVEEYADSEINNINARGGAIKDIEGTKFALRIYDQVDCIFYRHCGLSGIRNALLLSHVKNANAVIFCCDLTDSDGLREVERMLKEVDMKYYNDPIKFLAMTKADSPTKKISWETAKQFAEDHGMAYSSQVSARCNSNVDELFLRATSEIAKKLGHGELYSPENKELPDAPPVTEVPPLLNDSTITLAAFKFAYTAKFTSELFTNPFSSMRRMIKEDTLDTMEEVLEYARRNPESRTASVLASMKR